MQAKGLLQHRSFVSINDSKYDYVSIGLTSAEFIVLRVAVHQWIDGDIREILLLALDEIAAWLPRCLARSAWLLLPRSSWERARIRVLSTEIVFRW